MAAAVNVVCICPNLKLRNAIIRAIEETGGIKPVMKSDSESARRAHYAPALSKLIINTASRRMHEVLGQHSIALAIETDDRVAAANHAAGIIREAGFLATVHSHAEPEFPDGFLTFVQIPEANGVLLMFWPTPQAVTPEIGRTLPERKPWTDADLKSA